MCVCVCVEKKSVTERIDVLFQLRPQEKNLGKKTPTVTLTHHLISFLDFFPALLQKLTHVIAIKPLYLLQRVYFPAHPHCATMKRSYDDKELDDDAGAWKQPRASLAYDPPRPIKRDWDAGDDRDNDANVWKQPRASFDHDPPRAAKRGWDDENNEDDDHVAPPKIIRMPSPREHMKRTWTDASSLDDPVVDSLAKLPRTSMPVFDETADMDVEDDGGGLAQSFQRGMQLGKRHGREWFADEPMPKHAAAVYAGGRRRRSRARAHRRGSRRHRRHASATRRRPTTRRHRRSAVAATRRRRGRRGHGRRTAVTRRAR